jgi:hypothetical protein
MQPKGEVMRILSLVFSFLITAFLATLTLIYLERRVGQQRIYVQDEWLSSSADSAQIAVAAPDTSQLR